jgi:hypothetical protein
MIYLTQKSGTGFANGLAQFFAGRLAGAAKRSEKERSKTEKQNQVYFL